MITENRLQGQWLTKFDSGSQRTYICERLANTLGLQTKLEQDIHLVTFGSVNTKTIRTKSTRFQVRLKDQKYMTITANVVPVISATMQRKAMHFASCEGLKNLVHTVDLADTFPVKDETRQVDLLIGNDYYLDLILPQRIEVQPALYLLT